MKKRLLAALLAMTMVAALAVSCGGDEGSSSGSGSSNDSSTASTVDDSVEPLTEITLPIVEETMSFSEWRAWSNDYVSNYGEILGIQEIEKLTNIHVDYTCVPSTAAKEKFGLLLASGEYPDMIEGDGGNVVYPGGLDAGIGDGVLRDMTEMVRVYMPNYRTLLEDYEDIKRIAITDTGKNGAIYMIRADVDGHTQTVAVRNEPAWCGMAIRQDWLDELNMEVPTTIDELYDVLVAFKDNYGAWMHLYQDGTMGNDYILSAFGVTQDFYMVDGGTEVAFGPSTDAYKQYLELMRDWYAEGLIDPDFASTNSTAILTDNEYYANDKCGVGMVFQGTCGAYHLQNGYTDNEDMYLEPIVAPVLNEGDEVVTTYQSAVACNPQMITSSVTDEELPILAQFLDWHYTYDYAVIQGYGVEGTTYTIDENSEDYFVYTDHIIHPETEGMTITAARYLESLFNNVGYMDWTSGFSLYEVTGNDWSAKAYETWEKQTDKIMVPLNASFTADESQEYQNLFVDIESYVAENTVQFIMGTKDIDSEWDSFVSGLEGMDVARCVELKQASVDRYYGKQWILEQ